ncbi:MAG: single-stranded DNA-binding protein [Leptolyngbyaceae cyanobacterium bins.59]|nr:single-stranded DNA-binding protein [Leptolyngbyaceae cyanobacterium bins.59]
MNNCVLMGEIVQDPQLRYTADSQLALAEFAFEIPGMRQDEAPARLKVVGWGNLAQEIQENYHEGDRVIIEGRLSMNTIERPEGFKEKRAEVTVQRIHRLGATGLVEVSSGEMAVNPAASASRNPGSASTSAPAAVGRGVAESKPKATKKAQPYSAPAAPEADLDEIPF